MPPRRANSKGRPVSPPPPAPRSRLSQLDLLGPSSRATHPQRTPGQVWRQSSCPTGHKGDHNLLTPSDSEAKAPHKRGPSVMPPRVPEPNLWLPGWYPQAPGRGPGSRPWRAAHYTGTFCWPSIRRASRCSCVPRTGRPQGYFGFGPHHRNHVSTEITRVPSSFRFRGASKRYVYTTLWSGPCATASHLKTLSR